MAEYINREELIAACKKTHFAVSANDHPYDVVARVGKYFRRCVDEAPAADVVEVVRCKDCIYYQPLGEQYTYKDKPAMHCLCHSRLVKENGYCDEGIRKERE